MSRQEGLVKLIVQLSKGEFVGWCPSAGFCSQRAGDWQHGRGVSLTAWGSPGAKRRVIQMGELVGGAGLGRVPKQLVEGIISLVKGEHICCVFRRT